MGSESKLRELEEVFSQVKRKITMEWNKHLEPGISGSQVWMLHILEEKGSQKVSELAEALEISLPAVTGLSDKLIASGYAQRERSEEDRRIVLLHITDKGKEMLKSIREQRRLMMKKHYEGLSDEDLDHLIRIYHQVLKNIQSKGAE
ncbi:MarR family winged helix-turn-helix transcriptional regulator [Effusibacillus consociatus]|uniref:MarR family winged helix-turn-helix transcriptional regulator n=1 Tax=Effusibacillus consociatus TaxID=1117041 RepID=A0ABV9PYP6_9BACL